MDPLEIINEMANPTAEQQEVIDVAKRFNDLKRSRTSIYASITGMHNNINKVMHRKDIREWKELEHRAMDAKHQLWTITLELNKFPIKIKKEEVVKALSYQKKIEIALAKITSHIQAMEMGIQECIDETRAALEPEMPADDMNRMAAQHAQAQAQAQKQADDAALAAAAAGAPPPILGGAAAAGGDADPITIGNLANLVANMLRHAPPPAVTTLVAPAAAAAPAATPVKDYRGLKPIEIPTFSGDTFEYHYLKKAFAAAHDYRNLDKTTLALLLKSHLKGPASRLAQLKLRNKIDDTSYQILWDTLDKRYGGDYNETISITEQFNKLPVLTSLDFKELERTYNSFELQHDYYSRHDPHALTHEKSMLHIQAKQKFSVDLGKKFIRWCEEGGNLDNFSSTLEWLGLRYKIALKSEREYHPCGERNRDAKSRFNFND